MSTGPYIISRADGRIYVGYIELVLAGNKGDTCGLVGWADTDKPTYAVRFVDQAVAEWHAEQLRKLALRPGVLGIHLANVKLRDFAVRLLEGAVQYDGHRLAEGIDGVPE